MTKKKWTFHFFLKIKMSSIRNQKMDKDLRKVFMSVYFDQTKIYKISNFIYEQGWFCCYNVYKVITSIQSIRKRIIFDIFEYLVDYLVVICEMKTNRCFNHLKMYNCLNYSYPSFTSKKIRSLVNFYKEYNFNLDQPFRILYITKRTTKYGDSYIVEFCNTHIIYKTWLPKSAYNTIMEQVDKSFSTCNRLYLQNVYFRTVQICEYKGKVYPKIECKQCRKDNFF